MAQDKFAVDKSTNFDLVECSKAVVPCRHHMRQQTVQECDEPTDTKKLIAAKISYIGLMMSHIAGHYL